MTAPRLDQPRWFRGPVHHDSSEWLFNQAKSQAGQDLFVIAMTQGRRHGTWLELGCGDPIRSNNTYLLEKRLAWRGISIDLARQDQDMETPYEEYWRGFYQTIRRPDWPQETQPLDQYPGSDQIRQLPYYRDFIQRQMTDIDNLPRNQRDWQSARPNTKFFQIDALTFDYNLVPDHCDYLQVDLHPSTASLVALERILPQHRFGVITFEHDAWDRTAESAQVQQRSREILEAQGYDLVISDVTVPPGHGNGHGDKPINFEDWWADPGSVDQSIRDQYRNLDSSGAPKYYWDLLFREAV